MADPPATQPPTRRAMVRAYLLWAFLGFVSAHRIFLKTPLSATIQAVMLWIGIALLYQNPANRDGAMFLIALYAVYWLADVLMIPDLLRACAADRPEAAGPAPST